MGKFERRLSRQKPKSKFTSDAWRDIERVVQVNHLPRALGVDFVPDSHCGHCGKRMDLASNHKAAKPKPGDLGVCWNCAGINRYGEGLQLEKVTDEEFERLAADEYDSLDRLVELRALIRAAMTRSYERSQGDA